MTTHTVHPPITVTVAQCQPTGNAWYWSLTTDAPDVCPPMVMGRISSYKNDHEALHTAIAHLVAAHILPPSIVSASDIPWRTVGVTPNGHSAYAVTVEVTIEFT